VRAHSARGSELGQELHRRSGSAEDPAVSDRGSKRLTYRGAAASRQPRSPPAARSALRRTRVRPSGTGGFSLRSANQLPASQSAVAAEPMPQRCLGGSSRADTTTLPGGDTTALPGAPNSSNPTSFTFRNSGALLARFLANQATCICDGVVGLQPRHGPEQDHVGSSGLITTYPNNLIPVCPARAEAIQAPSRHTINYEVLVLLD